MRTVVVTGGSSGIGKATAQLFATKGYKVFELSRHGTDEGNVKHITADVCSVESVESALEQLKQYTDGVDVLINNAGYGISGAIEQTDIANAKRQFDGNFFGMATVTRACLPLIKRNKGMVINLSSVAGALPIPFQAYYSASKAAINSYSSALANELRPFGVRVCAVMPGDASTGFTQNRVKMPDDNAYGKRVADSVKSMENDEREGMTAQTIAKRLFDLSQKKRLKPLYTVGGKYKFFMALAKILPYTAVNRILGEMYSK